MDMFAALLVQEWTALYVHMATANRLGGSDLTMSHVHVSGPGRNQNPRRNHLQKYLHIFSDNISTLKINM